MEIDEINLDIKYKKFVVEFDENIPMVKEMNNVAKKMAILVSIFILQNEAVMVDQISEFDGYKFTVHYYYQENK